MCHFLTDWKNCFGKKIFEMKKISAVIPTIGRPKYLDKAIASLLHQIVPFDEVVIFDNSKTQNLREFSSFANDSRLRWENSGKYLDALVSWNTAVSLCRNEYVTIFGDDDLAFPTFHKKAQFLLERSDFCVLPFERIDENDKKIKNYMGIFEDLRPSSFRFLRMKGKLDLVVPGVVFKKDKFKQVGSFTDVGLPNYLFPDDFLWFKLSACEQNVAVSGEVCWQYRVHSERLGALQTLQHFSGRFGKFTDLLISSMKQLELSESEIFPPDFNKQCYIDRCMSEWFGAVVRNQIKSNRFTLMALVRELYFYLTSEATFKSKMKGFFKIISMLFYGGIKRCRGAFR